LVYVVSCLLHDYLCFIPVWVRQGQTFFWQLTKGGSPTINDLRYLAIDSLHPSVDASHPVIDTTSGLQQLRSSHPSLLLRQPIQPHQSVLNIGPSNQLSQIFF
jgi:hypothetical protein